MSDTTAGGAPRAWPSRLGAEAAAAGGAPDVRRLLQLALAAIWLLDGLLQYQGFMFTKGFSDMLAASAAGNPGVIARPVTWDATLVEHHLVAAELGLRHHPAAARAGHRAGGRRVRLALAASIAWSLGVWWFGEGLGGVLTGDGKPAQRRARRGDHLRAARGAAVAGGPRRGRPRSPRHARSGAPVARALWLVLWLSLAYFALLPGNRAPQACTA